MVNISLISGKYNRNFSRLPIVDDSERKIGNMALFRFPQIDLILLRLIQHC